MGAKGCISEFLKPRAGKDECEPKPWRRLPAKVELRAIVGDDLNSHGSNVDGSPKEGGKRAARTVPRTLRFITA